MVIVTLIVVAVLALTTAVTPAALKVTPVAPDRFVPEMTTVTTDPAVPFGTLIPVMVTIGGVAMPPSKPARTCATMRSGA